jgi:hypothetical protein
VLKASRRGPTNAGAQLLAVLSLRFDTRSERASISPGVPASAVIHAGGNLGVANVRAIDEVQAIWIIPRHHVLEIRGDRYAELAGDR